MQKLHAAVWQYYKLFLSFFFICAGIYAVYFFVCALLNSTFVPFPFVTLFFFLFVFCTGNTLERLFLQMQIPRRTQQKAFWAFLPAALLGAAVKVLSAHTAYFGGMEQYCPKSYYVQQALYGEEIFGGSLARVTLLSLLLNTLTLLSVILAARVLYVFWKNTTWVCKVLVCVAIAVVLSVYGISQTLEDLTDNVFLSAVYAFFFGNAHAAPSLLCAKCVQIAFLSLCLHLLYAHQAKKHCHKVKSAHKTAFACIGAGAVCAVTVLGILSVYYCTPVAVNHYELDKEQLAQRQQVYLYGNFAKDDLYTYNSTSYKPNEKAYRLLQTQERFAETPYQIHIARHMADKYYTPDTALPYTDFESGRRYYETYLTAAFKSDYGDAQAYLYPPTVFSSLRFEADDVPSLYCRYLYDHGARDEAFAYYEAVRAKKPDAWLPKADVHDWEAGTDAPALENNFLWYLYTEADPTDAMFAAREIADMLSSKVHLRTEWEYAIQKFDLLWTHAPNDAVRAYLADEIASFATVVLRDTAPDTGYSGSMVQEIREAAKALCEKAGVENQIPKGALE